MMSLDMNEIAEEFLVIKDFFDKLGYELVDTKDINNEILYLVKEKNHSKKEFLAIKDFFDKIKYELIGTKDINKKILYVVRKKRLRY